MEPFIAIAQIIIALGIFNVWILRYEKATDWRGGDSRNMKEEFATYGFPAWVRRLTRFTKLGLAALLIVGLWFKSIAVVAAALLAALMLIAIGAHAKVGDPLVKSLPAFALFVLSIAVAVGNTIV